MKTSQTQSVMMVEFMERNGDLSKPSGGPRGRHYIQKKWQELTERLNSDGLGDSRSEEKWRKVWSDLKNNTKKKWAKINKAVGGTGGGPAIQISLTDLENRVMQIIGLQAASGMAVMEAGFQQNAEYFATTETSASNETYEFYVSPVQEEATEDWNTPGTSGQPTAAPPAPPARGTPVPDPLTPPNNINDQWKPPAPKKKKTENLTSLFVECDRSAREYARERDEANERLEFERLRVQEFDIRERVRQRDLELNLQVQWLDFMKEAMNVIKSYLDK